MIGLGNLQRLTPGCPSIWLFDRRSQKDRFETAHEAQSLRSVAAVTSETFKSTGRGWARSSEGYAVRIVGRNDLQYTDELGDLSIFAEPTYEWTDIVVETAAIPDRPGRPREEVVSRLRRAFEFRGWTMIDSTTGSNI